MRESAKREMLTELTPSWFALLICPQCTGPLICEETDLVCSRGHRFPHRQGRVYFQISEVAKASLNSSAGQEMSQAYRQGNRWLQVLRRIISSEYFPGKAWRQAKKETLSRQPTLVLGSGVTHYPNCIHLDLDDFPGVDVVADGQRLPFADQSLAGVVCEVVLEHVEQANRLIGEVFRVLQPGGSVFMIVPFLFPYHGHPSDYRRWSAEGLKADFSDFVECEVGVHAGPCSAMVNLLSDWFALVLGQSAGFGYVALKGFATAILFPIKFLDAFLNRSQHAHRMAATLYIRAVKPPAQMV
ncbi:MAG: methyltransferase domain-containing protein [Acidobacteria bacterium]|nr:methyltransferase domain-containing protein [Acidobacteriota bacterium]